MRFPALALVLLFGLSAQAQTSAPRCFGNGEAASPDGNFSARVIRSGRTACGESRIEIYSGDGHLLTIADYTSSDGNSGEGVIQLQWSPDSRFLVYSLSQPPGRPNGAYLIGVYSGGKNKVRTLPAARPDFAFTEDALEVTGGDGKPVRLPLAGP